MSNTKNINQDHDSRMAGIFKLTLPAIMLLFLNLGAAAQVAPVESPKELLLQIQKSKQDTNRISLQLKLGSYYLFKPGEFKNDLDSAINFFNQAAQLSNKLRAVDWQYKTLALTGDYYVEAGNLDRCKQLFMRVTTYYHQMGNLAKEADYWYWLADLYNNNGKDDHREERITFYRRARSLYLQIHQPMNAAKALKEIAGIHTANKEFNLAETELQQVLTEYKSIGYTKLQYAYNLLELLEYVKGNYYRAMTYCSEGIKSMKASRDTGLAPNLYFDMARCNYYVKNYQEALEWTRKAIAADQKSTILQFKYYFVQILLALNRTEEARLALNNLGRSKGTPNFQDSLNRYRMFALYYDKINENDLAVRYYKRTFELDIKKRLSEESYNAWCLICDNNIAAIYLKENQAEKAEKYIIDAGRTIKNAKTLVVPPFLVSFYQNSYKYDLAVGNYRDAVENLEKHDRIQDSLSTVDKDNKIAELNIEYQTAQKEQSIKNLHNQGVVQQTKLEKANLQRNITIGGILFVSLFTGLFYRQYKQKQKANRLITQKNEILERLVTEKEWLLKEVHHRVKNNLHIVMSLLESQSSFLNNKAAITAILESQNRVRAIALIHQKLYNSANVVQVEMQDYVPELIKYLIESFNTADRKILVKHDIDRIRLDVSQAIPIGIILNEAITNAIKYAFNGQNGEIKIVMKEHDQDRVMLSITDNGKGLPPDWDVQNLTSLGMTLIKGLTTQLEGEFILKSDNGVKISIDFLKDENIHFNRYAMADE